VQHTRENITKFCVTREINLIFNKTKLNILYLDDNDMSFYIYCLCFVYYHAYIHVFNALFIEELVHI